MAVGRAAQFQAASFPKKGKIGQSTAYWGGMARNLWWQDALGVGASEKSLWVEWQETSLAEGWNGEKAEWNHETEMDRARWNTEKRIPGGV